MVETDEQDELIIGLQLLQMVYKLAAVRLRPAHAVRIEMGQCNSDPSHDMSLQNSRAASVMAAGLTVCSRTTGTCPAERS